MKSKSPTNFENVPTPEDWLPAYPNLRDLDHRLRCPICTEFFKGPIILTTCGHSFCSMCIRDSLQVKGNCPICHEKADDQKIRKCPILEEIVQAFEIGRSSLLEIVALASTSKPSLKRKSSKLENDADFTPQSSDDETPRRTSKRLKKLEKTSIVPTLVNGKGKSKDVVDISSDVEVIDIDDPDVSVECPICQTLMKQSLVSGHIDRGCKDPPKPSTNWNFLGRNSFKPAIKPSNTSKSPPLKRLSKIPPSKLTEMKKWLIEHNLSTEGSLEICQNRFRQYVNLHNANLDLGGNFRKSKEQLIKEMREWEKVRDTVRPTVASDHAKRHDDQFKQLAAQARMKAKLKAEAKANAKNTSVNDDQPVASTSTSPPLTTMLNDEAEGLLEPNDFDSTRRTLPKLTDETSNLPMSKTIIPDSQEDALELPKPSLTSSVTVDSPLEPTLDVKKENDSESDEDSEIGISKSISLDFGRDVTEGEEEDIDVLKPLPQLLLPKIRLPPPLPFEPTLPRPSQRERVL